ncbi:helix-turn-helix transcriptional regulator [Flavobacteriaceae bacterium S0825]|uniref:helix-turn-helix domain-containing protein n=1 Tax=Gaetbulibacter sp. S0825 TaxID=2720084 RepID=UPI001430C1C9|nr:helix-turn-helix transcriptional regulator [Gaetbulibacter sp. S0825]MCK0110448.1 helix-turn-helix transcriptional regulator [Flavobacteriaceae bacterium S0825]NIX66077.1 helix-turn-helix transcriptional regulator [Gaetbulibacter sp. S0825]
MNSDTSYIMVIETSDYLHRLEANQFNLFTQKLHNGISNLLKKFRGTILKHNDNTYVVSFTTVTNAVLCGLKLKANFKYITPKFDKSIRDLKLGITEGESKKSKVLATRMCEIVVNDKFVISEAVKRAYEKENSNSFINRGDIKILKSTEASFLTDLMNYVEKIWNDTNFNVSNFSKELGLSSSQFYRRLKNLTGKSPSIFLRDYRLKRAMIMLHYKKGNVTKISERTGFNSPAYFSKCFKETFNILPSKYMQQHT